ncbi:necdin-like 2 isoform X4 [Phycodurus eques]|uniref:necdin-like 2 isoform X4 n=1 Tax=Phycodurus eques TaxID=693459 RepID=UPI002ACD8615|nr:necdin-like 2 isoform X4 [Phycodurus eques]
MSQNKRLSNTQSSSLSKRLSGTPVAAGEDEDATQPSTSQVERSLKKLLPAQIDQKTAEVVEYILVKDQKKIPIRRGDLVKHVIKEYRNVYPEIMKRAAHTFEQVFGLKLVNIDAKNQLYILINKLEAIAGGPSFSSPDPKMGLLFVILSVIFMKRGVAKEERDMRNLATSRRWSQMSLCVKGTLSMYPSPTLTHLNTTFSGVCVLMWKSPRLKSFNLWQNFMIWILRAGQVNTEKPTTLKTIRQAQAAEDDYFNVDFYVCLCDLEFVCAHSIGLSLPISNLECFYFVPCMLTLFFFFCKIKCFYIGIFIVVKSDTFKKSENMHGEIDHL